MPPLSELRDEIYGYMNVLLGRKPAPVDHGILTLQEVANAYYARALEITAMIHDAEADGRVPAKSPLYKFRNGSLSDFVAIAKGAAELGSRRVTALQIEVEARYG